MMDRHGNGGDGQASAFRGDRRRRMELRLAADPEAS